MHIWHHARQMPRRYGANYGISLSIWDYLFGTVYVPKDGRDIELGFEEVEHYPQSFLEQQFHPFKKENQAIPEVPVEKLSKPV
jgi:sterol desaturase/sphingolipid hydroxylase (fatty acid hydroxylase superfamily)